MGIHMHIFTAVSASAEIIFNSAFPQFLLLCIITCCHIKSVPHLWMWIWTRKMPPPAVHDRDTIPSSTGEDDCMFCRPYFIKEMTAVQQCEFFFKMDQWSHSLLKNGFCTVSERRPLFYFFNWMSKCAWQRCILYPKSRYTPAYILRSGFT